MKIVVCVKQVPEKEARLRVAPSGNWIVEEGLGFAISECDRYGIEAALRLKEAGAAEAEVVVLSLGGERASKGIKEALAMGCDRAIHVNSDALLSADAVTIAKVLAAAARAESADLILCGQQSDDLSYNAVGPALAQFLDMRHVQIGLELELVGDSAVRVSHELDNNLIETVELTLPAVVGVQSGINDVRYASLKGIMQAGTKPLKKLTLQELGLTEADVAPKLRIEAVGFPVRTSQAEILEGDAKAVATQLVQKLINEAKVL